MRTRQASMTPAFIWVSALATPVAAQTFAQQVAQCSNEGGQGQHAPAVRITACTALLQSVDSRGLATVHIARGIAYFDLGEYVRAIADYNEAIRLNPQSRTAYSLRADAHERLGNAAQAAADRAEQTRLRGR